MEGAKKIRWVMLCAIILGAIELAYWSYQKNPPSAQFRVPVKAITN